ncbi:hypothetical protein L484_021381 [Morus notabilis]|uniref:Uncharacterized protein n=1 Tax=Morus notabilis TaxID=981085 RepID=W9RSZ6_9ROSA|nr:uncharacterized protein LOC21404240 [Morus notabilis]XP_024025129.1 uncharacterized protein LOC21404240 [Morus notabilis]EXB92397.1 hypothetical protein L484_021381 [Morus notabilis]
MLLNSGGGSVMAVACKPWWRLTCLASNSNAEQLRAQLDQLQSEADIARAKANNARMRLLRLSEAAENLKRQAAISVRTGKEDAARELLFQKKKVMEALEKSKNRIEFLDQLSTKLNQAISLKERQLIGNVVMDLEVVSEDASTPIRIVSPTLKATENVIGNEGFTSNDQKFSDDQELQSSTEDGEASLPVDQEQEDLEGSLPGTVSSEDEVMSGLKGITSFGGFLGHLDEQLNIIEAELVTVLRVSTLILDSEAKTKNFRVQQTLELLESIRGIRQRIANSRLAEVESK